MFSGSINMDNVLNNALNLFPVTQTPQQAQVKLQRLTYSATNVGPTEIQSTLARALYDDGVQYMSTLDMNRAASYTFGYRSAYGQNVTGLGWVGAHGESVADEMWALLVDWTLTKYTQHSPLALTKTINLILHVLLHGSEECVLNGELLYRIEMAVEPLRNLNTALVEQQMVEQILNSEGISGKDNDIVLSHEGIGHQLSQLGTRATATMIKLRGGSVDKGYPVRTAASKLYGIISNPNNLRQLRMQQQQQPSDSLVPIGNAKQVGYITDEGRFKVLQQKMVAEERALKQKQLLEQQRMNKTRSNLAGTSASDSFGGGYTSNVGGSGGKVVVGAAHSLADMIESAKYELEQHKIKHNQTVSSLKKGYTDDLSARAQQLKELERTRVESDPEFVRKERALQDALEYLEEMQRLDQEKVGDLLEGDLLGNGQDVLQGGGTTFGDNADGADLLGFGGNATAWAPASGTGNQGAGVSADLLGFGGQLSGYNNDIMLGGSHLAQPIPTNSGYDVGNSINFENNMNTHVRNVTSNSDNFNMRSSLVTGITGGAEKASTSSVVTSPQLSSPTPAFYGMANDMYGGGAHSTIHDEEAEAEKSRKMHLANGLFAGVLPAVSATAQQKQPIMHSSSDPDARAFDDLIPIPGTSLSALAGTNNSSAFISDDLTPFVVSSFSDSFGMGGLMGGSSLGHVTSIAPPLISSYHDPFGTHGPMGGSSISNVSSIAPLPSMPSPPPPPSMPPPPPPTTTTPQAVSNLFSNNPSVEQMQEMIKQQQAQMNHMMNLMQQMQMQGSNSNSNSGVGTPPP